MLHEDEISVVAIILLNFLILIHIGLSASYFSSILEPINKSYIETSISSSKMISCSLQSGFSIRMSQTLRGKIYSRKSILLLFFSISVVLVSGFDVSRSTLSTLSSFSEQTRQQTLQKHRQTQSPQRKSIGITESTSRKNTQMKASSSSLLTPTYPIRIAVMGGGNFGLAMGTICARQGLPTTILVRDEEVANCINREHTHPRYMSDIQLPNRLRATADPNECLPDATYIIHAVPCQYSRKFLESVASYIPAQTPVLSVSKGIETSSMGFMANVIRDVLGEHRPLAFLSGPSFAREIVEGVGATAVVIASEDLDLARDLAALLSDCRFKCFTSTDVIGVEIGGAVKNVIALGAGMCEGLGLGTNAMSGLVTRGCNEMRRLGLLFGAKSSTIAGLSGKKQSIVEICVMNSRLRIILEVLSCTFGLTHIIAISFHIIIYVKSLHHNM